ncbi:MAG: hypothetical protein RJA35_1484, partial [Actinomycetota bacterium]
MSNQLTKKYDAILLTSFGGPEGPDEVMPYLERVTAGRGVPYERLVEVSHHYLALGGVSPINQQNRELLAAMLSHFPTRGIDLPIYWGNRNSEPYFADVLKQMYADGHKNILAFVTSAYSSYSGCRQYRENLAVALEESGLSGEMNIDKVRHYFDHPGFLSPVATDLARAISGMRADGLLNSEIAVMFATHSIPSVMGETSGPEARTGEMKTKALNAPDQYGEAVLKVAGAELPWNETRPAGGAYAAQHLAAARAILEMVKVELGPDLPHWSLVYQSRSGAPTMPWLEPDINDAISVVSKAGGKGVIVVPIGFVSDHVEVVWDLDNEAKETCEELGLAFDRVRTSGVAAEFVDGIADLILERTSGGPAKALSDLGPWASFCAANCCPNSRRQLPV